MHLPAWVKLFIPPIVWVVLAPFRRRAGPPVPEWEYLPDGWPAAADTRKVKGWNVQEVVDAYRTKWPAFVERMNAAGPLDVSPEATLPAQSNLVFHNTIMAFAYVLAAAARQKKSLSMLDWGGGPGHYYLIAQRLLPAVRFEYSCKDVAVLAEYGQTLWPEAHYYSDNRCFERQYDLVMASGSMHYVCDWRDLLSKLAGSAGEYLFVTRLPTVERAASFVFIQRPYAYGYNTEYTGWCLNRADLLQQAEAAGLALVREFVTGERPVIANAPEQCVYRGFLFQRGPAPEAP
jgi:putative methyltransferase (TIGR04325 family)